MTENIELLTHSSIRIAGEEIIYIDPFRIDGTAHDADIILITHDHFDHFSPEDIAKIIKESTILVVPVKLKAQASALPCGEVINVSPGMRKQIGSIAIETIPAYNEQKPFHSKGNGWVGYIVEVDGKRIYIAGDTDLTEESRDVSCDVAMVPVGGTYTMDAKKAAELINIIKPKVAIPTHYGSTVGTKKDAAVFKENVDRSIPVEIIMQKM